MSFPITSGDAEPLPFLLEGGGLGYYPGQLWLDTSYDPPVLFCFRDGCWRPMGMADAATRLLELYDRLDAAADLLDEIDPFIEGWAHDKSIQDRIRLARGAFRLP